MTGRASTPDRQPYARTGSTATSSPFIKERVFSVLIQVTGSLAGAEPSSSMSSHELNTPSSGLLNGTDTTVLDNAGWIEPNETTTNTFNGTRAYVFENTNADTGVDVCIKMNTATSGSEISEIGYVVDTNPVVRNAMGIPYGNEKQRSFDIFGKRPRAA